MKTRVHPILVTVLPLALALALAPGAGASSGVAIDLGKVGITQTLQPGGSYRLPPLGVRNPGTRPGRYKLVVSISTNLRGRQAPAGWFGFSPTRFSLRPAKTKAVAIILSVPADARPGRYVALVGPELEVSGSGAKIGAAAAARITFAVGSSSWLAARWLELKTFFSSNAPWSYLVPGLLGAAGALALLRRRFRLTIAVGKR